MASAWVSASCVCGGVAGLLVAWATAAALGASAGACWRPLRLAWPVELGRAAGAVVHDGGAARVIERAGAATSSTAAAARRSLSFAGPGMQRGHRAPAGRLALLEAAADQAGVARLAAAGGQLQRHAAAAGRGAARPDLEVDLRQVAITLLSRPTSATSSPWNAACASATSGAARSRPRPGPRGLLQVARVEPRRGVGEWRESSWREVVSRNCRRRRTTGAARRRPRPAGCNSGCVASLLGRGLAAAAGSAARAAGSAAGGTAPSGSSRASSWTHWLGSTRNLLPATSSP